MFKIAKLEKIDNEIVDIGFVTQQRCAYDNGLKVLEESFETLSFEISGDVYSLSFALNCRLEKLLEIPMSKAIDFKNYIFHGETCLNVKGMNGIEPEMDIKITKYLNNKFIIFLTFYTDCGNDNYSGVIEFTFDLDDYLDVNNK